MSLLIFGCGYLGQRVASLYSALGREVHVVTRSEERAVLFQSRGWHAVIADPGIAHSLTNLPRTDHVLFAVGFDRSGGRSIHEVFVGGLRNVLTSIDENVQRFVYISSTGVYGQATGRWVDEQSDCNPLGEGGKACLAAEQLLSEHPVGQKANVLRLGGIYGPNRIPRLKDIAAGQPIAAPSEGYLNLIHVDDAASIVVAVADGAPHARTYVVTDGNPVQRCEYFEQVARLAGAPKPTFVAPSATSPAARRAATNKRVSNRRLIEEVPVQLKYPSYREGLAAIIGNGKT